MSDVKPPSESRRRPSSGGEPSACEVRASGRAAAWVRPPLELDLSCARRFATTVKRVLSDARLVIVDLRELTFIDSTGLEAMIEVDAWARRRNRRLVFVRGPEEIDRLFDLIGLSDRLEFIDLKPSLVPRPEQRRNTGPNRPDAA